jgi:ATP-dependent protease ClpP protease subunit
MALDCIKKGPILMKINCPGGSIEDGLSIIDTMNELRSNVHTEVCGTAASMATAIALAGDKRLITANSHMMFHEMARYCADYYSKEKHRFKFEEKLWLSMRQFYIRKTKFTSADMSLIDTGELWLSAKECLAKGIVDDVVGETWS